MLGDLLATTRKATVDGHAPDVAPVIIILAHHLLQELAKLRRGVGEGGSRGEAGWVGVNDQSVGRMRAAGGGGV